MQIWDLHPIETQIRDINRVFVWHRISKINPLHPEEVGTGRICECVPSGVWFINVPYRGSAPPENVL